MSNEIINSCGCCGTCCLEEDGLTAYAITLNSNYNFIDSVGFYSGNVFTKYLSCYYGTVQTFSREELGLPNRRECAGGGNSYWLLRIQQNAYYSQATSRTFSGEISQDGYLIGLPESYDIYCRYGAYIYLLCFTRTSINYRLEFVHTNYSSIPNIYFYSYNNNQFGYSGMGLLGYGINYNFTVKLFNNDTGEVINKNSSNTSLAVVFTFKLITTLTLGEVIRNMVFYASSSSIEKTYTFGRTISNASTGFFYDDIIDIVPLKVEFYLGLKLIKTMNLKEIHPGTNFFEGVDQL